MQRDSGDATALTLLQARQHLDAAVQAVADIERVALPDGLDRVLACDLVSGVAVPAHDNAAMDGYALRSGAGSRRRRIVGQSRAGHPYDGPVDADACVRILTGAVMPADCDAVVPQEEVTVSHGHVAINGPVRTGQHRRFAGEDLQPGSIVIAKGRRITPSDLGLAASVGSTMLDVVRRPRVAVFSTGDELRDPGHALHPGSIRDSNRYTLLGMLRRLGVEAVDLGIVGDDPAALEATIVHACGPTVRADAIVTSGGVSAGDADYTRDVMHRLGSVSFWKLAIKPGRPMAFGRVGSGTTGDARSAWLFGLPGNPVAVMVVFYALVREALLKLMGARIEPMPSISATCQLPLPKLPGRSEFIRGIATHDDGGWRVTTTGTQGSGILRSMSEANCLIVLEHDRGPVAAGEQVDAWPFHGLI